MKNCKKLISIPRRQTFEMEFWWLFEYDQIRAHTCDFSSEMPVTTTTDFFFLWTSVSFSCVSWSVNEKQLGQMRELCLKIKDEQSLYSSIQGEGQMGIALQLSQLDLVIWGIINSQVINGKNVTNIFTKIVYIKCGFEVSIICIWGSWMIFLTKDWKNIRSGFEVNRICI